MDLSGSDCIRSLELEGTIVIFLGWVNRLYCKRDRGTDYKSFVTWEVQNYQVSFQVHYSAWSITVFCYSYQLIWSSCFHKSMKHMAVFLLVAVCWNLSLWNWTTCLLLICKPMRCILKARWNGLCRYDYSGYGASTGKVSQLCVLWSFLSLKEMFPRYPSENVQHLFGFTCCTCY